MGPIESGSKTRPTGNAHQIFNIYCDESGHLEKEPNRVMVLGAVWCPAEKSREVADDVRKIKREYGIGPRTETKWTKVSPAQGRFYLELVDYFFGNEDLHFRAVVIPDKSLLDHDGFGQDHDTWYYKMLFTLLSPLLDPGDRYRIYLDIKDTRSSDKIAKLHKVLSNNAYDFSREIVERVQTVRSHEVEALQLADLLIGAVSYANRRLSGNKGKEAIVKRIRQCSGYSMTKTTLLREDKFNVFIWRASETHA